jgi:hypothetical protein
MERVWRPVLSSRGSGHQLDSLAKRLVYPDERGKLSISGRCFLMRRRLIFCHQLKGGGGTTMLIETPPDRRSAQSIAPQIMHARQRAG